MQAALKLEDKAQEQSRRKVLYFGDIPTEYSEEWDKGYRYGYKKAQEETRLQMQQEYAERREAYRRRKKIEKARKRYFIKQKLSGAALIVAALVGFFTEYDITVALFMVPVGLVLIFSKDTIMDFKQEWK